MPDVTRRAAPGPAPIVRTVRFDLRSELAGCWNGGSPVRTALFNALSLFLPAGEDFFVRAVREIQAAQGGGGCSLDAFVRQESAHRRQHELCNARIGERFASVGRTLRYMDRSWAVKRALMGPLGRLAVTVVIEHLTSIMARVVLSQPTAIADAADRDYANLWRWHALEELEHKSVAFDYYRRLGGSRARLAATMVIVTVVFSLEYLGVLAALLADEQRLAKPTTWRSLFGIWRSAAASQARAEYATFFSRRFSPSMVDDSELVARWRADEILASHVLKPRQ